MEFKIVPAADDPYRLFQTGPLDPEIGVRESAVFGEAAHGAEASGELEAVGLLQELGVKGCVVADGQVGPVAEIRHLDIVAEVQRVVAAGHKSSLLYNTFSQSIHTDGFSIVRLERVVKTVKFFLDPEFSKSVIPPRLYIKGGKAEN